MAITMNKWLSMSNAERLEYIRKGAVKVKAIFPRACSNGETLTHEASCRGIAVGHGSSEDQAFRNGYQFLSEYDGELPMDDEKQGDE